MPRACCRKATRMDSRRKKSSGPSGAESKEPDVQKGNIVSVFVFLAFVLGGVLNAIALGNPVPIVPWVLVGIIVAQSPRIAQQWERAIVLRLGRYHSMPGPGLFWIIPFIDT